jgi:hypothetical protein
VLYDHPSRDNVLNMSMDATSVAHTDATCKISNVGTENRRVYGVPLIPPVHPSWVYGLLR